MITTAQAKQMDEYEIEDFQKALKDIIYFAENYIRIDNKDLIKLYPKQKEVLKSWVENSHNVHNHCRQFGGTTLQLIYAIFIALTKPNKCTMIFCKKEDMAKEYIDRLKQMVLNISTRLIGLTTLNKETINFSNGSSIRTNTYCPDATCSITINHAILDNPDYVNKETFKEFMQCFMPCISSLKKPIIVIGGTPSDSNSFQNKKYKESLQEGSKWSGILSTFMHVPKFATEKWKKDTLELLGKDSKELFNREYELDFTLKQEYIS